MAGHRSKTYRLQLSDEGTDLFLSCHSRLARIARNFIPYGATLSVALILADTMDAEELVAELAMPSCKRLAGKKDHYVGASAHLRPFAANILERVARSDHISVRPTIGRLYLAAIAVMAASEEQALANAYRRLPSLFQQG